MERRRPKIWLRLYSVAHYKVHKTKGNLNNHIGLPLTLLHLEETTQFAVVEMGMSGRGEIALLVRTSRAGSRDHHDDWRVAYASAGLTGRDCPGESGDR